MDIRDQETANAGKWLLTWHVFCAFSGMLLQKFHHYQTL